jgi:hypothetical protein
MPVQLAVEEQMTILIRTHGCAPVSNHSRLKRDGSEEYGDPAMPIHAMASTDN